MITAPVSPVSDWPPVYLSLRLFCSRRLCAAPHVLCPHVFEILSLFPAIWVVFLLGFFFVFLFDFFVGLPLPVSVSLAARFLNFRL